MMPLPILQFQAAKNRWTFIHRGRPARLGGMSPRIFFDTREEAVDFAFLHGFAVSADNVAHINV